MPVSDASSGRLNGRFVCTSVSSNPNVFIVGAPPIDRSANAFDLRLAALRSTTRARAVSEVRREDCERITMDCHCERSEYQKPRKNVLQHIFSSRQNRDDGHVRAGRQDSIMLAKTLPTEASNWRQLISSGVCLITLVPSRTTKLSAAPPRSYVSFFETKWIIIFLSTRSDVLPSN